MKNFSHPGMTLDLTAPYNVLSGGGVKVGNTCLTVSLAVNRQVFPK